MADNERSTTSRPGGASVAEHALEITRVFKAPAARVFAAWTERDRIRQWLGPHGFTATLFESDARPGGAWRSRMRGPDGKELGQHGVIGQISPPRRFAFTQQWENETSPETTVTIDLAEREGRTTMRFHQGDFDSVESRDSHEDGWSQSFDRLERYLATAAAEER